MISLVEALNGWGEHALRFAWPMLWQSSLLITAVFALDFSLRRKVRAAVRYSLWLVVLVKLLLPPSLALPTGLAWWLCPSAQPPPKPRTTSYMVTYGPVARPILPAQNASVSAPPPPPRMSLAAWSFVTSGVISLGLLGWMLLRWRRVAQDVRRAIAPPAWLAELLAATCRQAGINRPVPLRLTDHPMSPAVCGLFRPVILLPRSVVARLAPHRLRTVLLHELFHLRRCDVWINFVQTLLNIAYFWHPFLWLANARIRRLREEAVDDAVMLALRDDAETYAPTLLEVAKLAFDRPLTSLGLVGILESRNALRKRIERLLNFRAPQRAGLSLLSILGILTFTALAVPMGEAPSNLTQPATLAKTSETHWPDPRFQGYQQIDLEAQFMIVDEASLRAMLPSLADSRQPLIVASNEIADLEIKLKQANARQFSENDPLQFPKFSGGHFRWQIGGTTNNMVGWQTRSVDDRNIVIGADVEFIATQPDWTPLEFALVPWDESDSVRCQMKLSTRENTNAVQQAEVTIPLRGAVVWATPDRTASGNCELVFLRQKEADSPPNSNSRSQNTRSVKTQILATNRPAWEIEGLGPASAVEYDLSSRWATASNGVRIRHGGGTVTADRITVDQQTGELTADGAVRVQHNNTAPGIYPRTNLIHTSKGRQAIMRRLDGIRLERVFFDNLPLADVVRNLNEEIKKRDPEKKGINFIINKNVTTGPSGAIDVNAIPIKINPALTDVRLADVLDAIVKVASVPIKYSIEDYAIVISLRGEKGPSPLYVRIIKVDSITFMQGLKNLVSAPSGNTSFLNGTGSTGDPPTNNVQATVSQFFSSLGVDLTPPKKIFFNDREGTLIVRATLDDMDTIETAVQVLNIAPPQVNIKIKYIELPEVEANAFGEKYASTNHTSSGSNLVVLTEAAARLQLKKWEAMSQVSLLNEGSVTTLSGRQAQIQCDIPPSEIQGAPNSLDNTLRTNQVALGPILDVLPWVTADGFLIQMMITNTITEFLGYDDPGQYLPQVRTNGRSIKPPQKPLPLPRFRLHQVSQNAIVRDGQTLVLGLAHKPLGPPPRNKSSTYKSLIIFVTPTIIDPAGKRYHSDEEPLDAR